MNKLDTKKVDKDQALAFHKMLVEHCIDDIPKDCKKKVIYVLKGDGVWQIRKNNIGIFVVHMANAKVPGLKKDLEEGWDLHVPLIPPSLLESTISFFREVYRQYQTEAHVQFFYDTKKEEYLLHCPKQEVTAGSVKYERDKGFEKPHLILVLEMHSHGGMSAFFSGTDDGDEKDDRFYGVVGKIKQFQPEMKFRLSIGGFKYDLNADNIFDLRTHDKKFPNKWLKNVTKKELKIFDYRKFGPSSGRQLDLQNYINRNLDPKDDEMFGLMEDHLYPKEEFLPSEEEYYLKDGDKTWLIQDGEKVCYFDELEVAHPVDEDEDDGIKELDFHDWRGRDF